MTEPPEATGCGRAALLFGKHRPSPHSVDESAWHRGRRMPVVLVCSLAPVFGAALEVQSYLSSKNVPCACELLQDGIAPPDLHGFDTVLILVSSTTTGSASVELLVERSEQLGLRVVCLALTQLPDGQTIPGATAETCIDASSERAEVSLFKLWLHIGLRLAQLSEDWRSTALRRLLEQVEQEWTMDHLFSVERGDRALAHPATRVIGIASLAERAPTINTVEITASDWAGFLSRRRLLDKLSRQLLVETLEMRFYGFERESHSLDAALSAILMAAATSGFASTGPLALRHWRALLRPYITRRSKEHFAAMAIMSSVVQQRPRAPTLLESESQQRAIEVEITLTSTPLGLDLTRWPPADPLPRPSDGPREASERGSGLPEPDDEKIRHESRKRVPFDLVLVLLRPWSHETAHAESECHPGSDQPSSSSHVYRGDLGEYPVTGHDRRVFALHTGDETALHYRVVYRTRVATARWHYLYAYTYLERATRAVIRDYKARLRDDGFDVEEPDPHIAVVVRGETKGEPPTVTVKVKIEGFELRESEQSFLLVEDWCRKRFRVRSASVPVGHSANGSVTWHIDDLLVARQPISVRVVAADDDDEIRAAETPRLKFFYSYSCRDARLVRRFRRAHEATGVEAVLCEDFRTGDDWRTSIKLHIRRADFVHLFWSTSSQTSRWVREEVRYAVSLVQLGTHPKDFVLPIAIGQPAAEELPQGVDSRHMRPFPSDLASLLDRLVWRVQATIAWGVRKGSRRAPKRAEDNPEY